MSQAALMALLLVYLPHWILSVGAAVRGPTFGPNPSSSTWLVYELLLACTLVTVGLWAGVPEWVRLTEGARFVPYAWGGWLIYEVGALALGRVFELPPSATQPLRLRGKRGRLEAARLFLSPIHEEVLHRGLLVGGTLAATDSLPIALFVGASADLALHAYQGLRAMPYHIWAFTVSVALFLGPGGLAAAVACHGLQNAVWVGRRLREDRASARDPSSGTEAP